LKSAPDRLPSNHHGWPLPILTILLTIATSFADHRAPGAGTRVHATRRPTISKSSNQTESPPSRFGERQAVDLWMHQPEPTISGSGPVPAKSTFIVGTDPTNNEAGPTWSGRPITCSKVRSRTPSIASATWSRYRSGWSARHPDRLAAYAAAWLGTDQVP